MIALLKSMAGGVWSYVIAFGLGVALATGGTYYVCHNANAVEIANLKTDAANQKSANVTAALTQLQGFINKMNMADTDYSLDLAAITAKFAALDKELKNAVAKPLPPDCHPDAARLHVLTDAIAAANAKAAATSP